MAKDKGPGSSVAASVALAITTVVVSVLLALLTDVPAPVRWGIALLAGVAAAALTTALVSRAGRI
ncbi:hypothetical protein [Nocardioides sp. CFH 31398]|uniref:hypothetical protein n=1 Tax=Nocardioides sp. CFH 31398 TaxID=2919579 RepID=UPI001F05F58D|nr:hypothetical protein [Nocardioides sp. CFH 31398]MCH1865195.1 hypothetical protein [Nocardioides sp. CFH 31398]